MVADNAIFNFTLLVVVAHVNLFQRLVHVHQQSINMLVASCRNLVSTLDKRKRQFLLLIKWDIMTTLYSLADVQKHKDREDCWIIVNGKVHN